MANLTPILDISLPLNSKLPAWPGSIGVKVRQKKSIKSGDPANVSELECDLHSGTHVDAPYHFFEDGKTVAELSLDTMVGPVYVADLPHYKTITPKELVSINLPQDTERLLLRTRNSKFWQANVMDFRKDYTALTAEAAKWIVDRGLKLIGIDYLSIQRFNDKLITHKILLKNNVTILEGLNLTGVMPGKYELLCLPIRLTGTEGAPARAVLREIANNGNQ
jgi:arylformamidase